MSDNFVIFTSESVSDGHPDKICDQISDALLDAYLTQDPHSRVAIETLVKTGLVLVAGEVRSDGRVDVEPIVRNTIKNIGYRSSTHGFDYQTCAVINAIGKQSSEIAQGVDATTTKKLGAGDQGLMFGFATDETPAYMPAPIYYAHQLMQRQQHIRQSNDLLLPDAKSQVTLRYDTDGLPQAVDAIVVSTQHAESVSTSEVRELVMEEIIKPVIPAQWLHPKTAYHINPTGRFVIGGPMGDCGVTGRKIIVDTYGGFARHGGGAFSGKDPSKVDRSAAYCCRYIAKNIVAAKIARCCEVQVSYAIGVSEPTSISFNTFDTSVDTQRLANAVRQTFDLTPAGIISALQLQQQHYQPTAAYGHFGREPQANQFSWERTDKVDELLSNY